MALSIRKGDLVQVIAGKDRGKRGVVERVIASTNRVVVAGINVVKKHLKKSQTNPRGGIVEVSASIHRSNVQHIAADTDKPTRTSTTVSKDGTKQRVSTKGGSLQDK
jgi:large subunit ribosomal protein L24